MASDNDKLQRHFDGELSSRRARRLVADLDQDDRVRLRSLEQMQQMVRSSVDEAAEEADFSGFLAAVEGRLSSSTAQPADDPSISVGGRAGRWLIGVGLGLAGAVAAAIVAVTLWHKGPTLQPSNDCVIETIDVGEGQVSTIFTIDDPELADATTVIWISENEGDTP